MEERAKRWNRNPTVKRWVLFVSILLAFLAMLYIAVFSGGEAQAVETVAEVAPGPYKTTTFTVVAKPVNTTPGVLSAATAEKCWSWGHGPWRDWAGDKLRYGYGVDVINCTNLAETVWKRIALYDPYHILGFWTYHWTHKSSGGLDTGSLRMSTQWEFVWPCCVPTPFVKSPLLRCEYRASNHTAYCTRYYN